MNERLNDLDDSQNFGLPARRGDVVVLEPERSGRREEKIMSAGRSTTSMREKQKRHELFDDGDGSELEEIDVGMILGDPLGSHFESLWKPRTRKGRGKRKSGQLDRRRVLFSSLSFPTELSLPQPHTTKQSKIREEALDLHPPHQTHSSSSSHSAHQHPPLPPPPRRRSSRQQPSSFSWASSSYRRKVWVLRTRRRTRELRGSFEGVWES